MTNYSLFISVCSKKCKEQHCRDVRENSIDYDPVVGIYGFIVEELFRVLYERYLLVEHLWINHILRAKLPERSKFLPVYACVKELHTLLLCCISFAIENKDIQTVHEEDGTIKTFYRAKFRFAIGSFIHPDVGKLYQFEMCTIFKDYSLANAFPFGNGYKIKRKPDPPKSKGKKGKGSGDPEAHLVSWTYPGGAEYKGDPTKKKKKKRGRKHQRRGGRGRSRH